MVIFIAEKPQEYTALVKDLLWAKPPQESQGEASVRSLLAGCPALCPRGQLRQKADEQECPEARLCLASRSGDRASGDPSFWQLAGMEWRREHTQRLAESCRF